MSNILLGIVDRRVYRVSDETLRSSVVRAGSYVSDCTFIDLIDLRSGVTISIPRIIAIKCVVPDREIYNVLKGAKISGLKETIKTQGEIDELPWSGNHLNPEWLAIILGGECDSRCSFCFTEYIRHQRGIEDRNVMKSLDFGRAAGAKTVVFSGGEPTLRKKLILYINRARSIGYDRVCIQTNGHRLAGADYLDRVVGAGLTDVLLSLHGPTREVHDGITRAPGSFDKAVQALDHIRNVGTNCIINFVACKDNGPYLEQMVDLIFEKGWKLGLRVSFLIIEGGAYDHVNEIVPTIPEFIEWVLACRRRARAKGVDLEVANVPPCVSERLQLAPFYLTSNRRTLLQVSPFYAAVKLRGEYDVRLEVCDGCRWSGDCSGVQMAYLAKTPNCESHFVPCGCV